ncbi:sigma factor [Gracilibacillus boraciitolerans]|uniref:sigma factor n=1 Tax=Gracilibacillus boraciitolerans TaxID=307521 RepID=UPI0026BA62C4
MKESLDTIYHKYFYDIYRFLLSLSKDHYTAEDLVQETFFRAHLNIEHYDGGNN